MKLSIKKKNEGTMGEQNIRKEAIGLILGQVKNISM